MEKKAGQGPPGRDTIPEMPDKNQSRKISVSKNTQDKNQISRSGPTNDRALSPKIDHNYAEPDSDDVNIEEDSEEDSDEMQQGYLCTSTDPRRIGVGGGETITLNSRELCKDISLQQNAKDQTIWMTTAQAGFPLERDEDEVTNSKDTQMGRITPRYLHPAISTFIANWEADLTSVERNNLLY